MRSNGFTLIELLAVIVILAIIALIAVPIVLGIINDSKKSSEKESLNLYTDTVEKAITKKQMSDPNFNPDKCDIKEKGNLECFNGTTSLGILEISMKGQLPSSGQVIIKNNKISYKNIVYNDKTYYEDKIATLVNDAAPTVVSYGDKYTYKVNDTDTFNFYVLSVEGDKVHLIMDRNICEDGTVATESNKCTVAWHAGEVNNNYGPDTAMTYLYNATKGWSNVPDMDLTYTDENNGTATNKGYTSITTSNGVATITGKNGASNTTIGTTSQPLKARLPREDEVTSQDAGCHIYKSSTYLQDYGTCSTWLVENLVYNDVSSYAGSGKTDKYNEINSNNGITKIYGYWLLSSESGYSYNALIVNYGGYVDYYDTSISSSHGVRPVITVLKSDLSN